MLAPRSSTGFSRHLSGWAFLWGVASAGLGLACSPGVAPAPAAPSGSGSAVAPDAVASNAVAPDAVAPDAVEAPAPLADDPSLDLAAYVEAGVPDPGQPWTAEQYEQASAALLRMAAKGRSVLPRRHSARSGALFARLVASEIAAAGSSVAGSAGQVQAPPSAAEAAEQARRAVAAVTSLFGVYAPASDGVSFGPEQVALVGALLQRLTGALERSRALASAGAAGAEQYRQQQLVVSAVLRGVLAMLAETSRYSAEERAELRGLLQRGQAALLAHVSAAERGELEEALASAK